MAERPREAVPEATDEPSGTLAAGTLVDHFEVVRLLAQGGMGAVYLARDLKLGRKVALKMIRPELLGARRFVDRFVAEARTTARFDHPNIVTIHAVGEHGGAPYVALGYVEGETLRERLAAGRFGQAQALRIAVAIAEAIAAAHAAGVLHRDLKPGNVILGRDGQVRVVDFGIARIEPSAHTDDAPPSSRRRPDDGEDATWGGGTPAYMSPEHWLGGGFEPASDVWALGMIAFELFAGAKPFDLNDAEQYVWQVCSDEPVSRLDAVCDVPVSLADLVADCLDKASARRPTADQVAARLRELLQPHARRLEPGKSPYRGLLPFTERDADVFFGREAEVAALLERTRTQPVLAVIGPSGAGKSSFVQAGFIPRLREQDRWVVVQLRPGSSPFHALARSLLAADRRLGAGDATRVVVSDGSEDRDEPPPSARSRHPSVDSLAQELLLRPAQVGLELHHLARQHDGRVLLAVDQLEELFTLTDDASVATRFMEALYSAADDVTDPVRIIFTLRHEFIDRLPSSDAVRRGLVGMTVLHRPRDDMLEEMLVAPLAGRGYRFEDGALVATMIAEVRGEVACLPLLQFAADLLWQQRDEKAKLLLRSAYDEMGGVAGALARHADGVLEELSATERALARSLLLRLVTSERTRRVMSRERALAGLAERTTEGERVLSRLVAARLITVTRAAEDGREEVLLELAHESLVSAWGTLARWLERSREDARQMEEIENAAELWSKRGRRPEELWQGAALREAAATLGRAQVAVPADVRSFVEEGSGRERRRALRRRASIAASLLLSAVVALVSVVVALYVSDKEGEANEQRRVAELREAEVEQRRAESLREAARGAFERGDVHEARAKVRMALEIEDAPAARVLWWRLEETPLRWTKRFGAIVYGGEVSPDGREIAVACQDGSVYLLDAVTAEARVFRGHRDQVLKLAFSPDGKTLASGTWSGEIRLWDVATGRTKRRLEGGTGSLTFTSDGQEVVVGGRDGLVRLHRVSSDGEPRRLDIEDAVLAIASGRTLAFGTSTGTLVLYDLDRAAVTASVKLHSQPLTVLVRSPDGRTIASAAADRKVVLWDVERATPRSEHPFTVAVWSLRFSPDGKLLAVGDADGKVTLWSADLRRRFGSLGHRGAASRVMGFSSAGDTMFNVSGTVVSAWSTRDLRDWPAPGQGHDGRVEGLALSPEHPVVASSASDGRVRLWDLPTGQQLRVVEPGLDLTGRGPIAFGADDRMLALGAKASIHLFDLETAEVRALGKGMAEDVALSADGATLVYAASHDVSIRDVATGTERRQLSGHTGRVNVVSLADGLLASGSDDGTVAIWELPSGTMRARVNSGAGVRGVAFSPDGSQVALGNTDGLVELWDWRKPTARELGRHEGRVYRLAFHPHGDAVASPCSDGTIRLWPLPSGTPVVLSGHRGEVNEVTFTRDGSQLVSASDDASVRLWDVATGRPFWRGFFVPAPPRIYSHRGWSNLDGEIEKRPPEHWAREVEERAASVSATDALVCLETDRGHVALWDRAKDTRISEHRVDGVSQVQAFAGGCAVRGSDGSWLIPPSGAAVPMRLDEPAVALSALDGELLVATSTKVIRYDGAGKTISEHAVGAGITALTRSVRPQDGGEVLLLGYGDGNIGQVRLVPQPDERSVSFAGTPASLPVTMTPGPAGTVVVGYASGVVGLWDLRDGSKLAEAKLHGAVTHIILDGHRIVAVSELGSHVSWSLEALFRDYCELLRAVWVGVPVVWNEGQLAPRAPDAHHACALR